MTSLERNIIEDKISAMGVDMRHRAMCQKILTFKTKGASIQEISFKLNVSTRVVRQILL